ncbi:MAG: hypothetical protein ACLPT4_05670 [Verrucomicrobiia bacterium]
MNQAFFTLQGVAYDPDPLWTDDARPLQIWINGQPYYDRSGTNIYIERFPVPPTTNSFTVTILVANQAGTTNQASQTWVVNTSAATNAPNLLTVNLSSPMLLPNVNSIWMEGAVDNDYALVNAVVTSLGTGDVSTNGLAVRQNQYEGLVPLENGTNQVVVVASNAAGYANSNVFTLISSTEFSAAITNPVFDVYATTPSNYVSGYVSTLFDAGLPTQTNVVGVLINGVAAVVNWNNPDSNGNVPFTTTNMIPSGVPITGQVWVAGCPPVSQPMIGGGGGSTCPPVTIPPSQSQTYEVLHWESHTDEMGGLNEVDFNMPSYDWQTCQPLCDGEWYTVIERTTEDNVQDISAGDQDESVVWEVAGSRCTADPDPETLSWTAYSTSQNSCTGTNGGAGANCSVNLPRSMSFGTQNIDGSVSVTYSCFCWGWGCPWAGEGLDTFRNRGRGTLTFRPPRSYGTNTVTVIFTFEGMTGPPDLSQVTYRGQSPYSYDNAAQTVSYKINVTGGQQYTINQDSFQWPSRAAPQVLSYAGTPFAASGSYHWLSFTNFHNHAISLIVQVVGMGCNKPNLSAAAQQLKVNYPGPQINPYLISMRQACQNAGTLSVYVYQGHAGLTNGQPQIAAYTGQICNVTTNCPAGVPTYSAPLFCFIPIDRWLADAYYLLSGTTPDMPDDFTGGQGMPPLVVIMGCESGSSWPPGFTQAGAKVVVYSGGEGDAATASAAINAFFNTLAGGQTIDAALSAGNVIIDTYNMHPNPGGAQMNDMTAVYGGGASAASTFTNLITP